MEKFLKNMLSIPALSGHEGARADFVADYLAQNGLSSLRVGNNLIARIEGTKICHSEVTRQRDHGTDDKPRGIASTACRMPEARRRKAEPTCEHQRATILLCTHLDTVPPWENHQIVESADRITGRGSNDAGASVACMVAAALHFTREHINHNIVLLLAAGEENSSPEGMAMALPHAGHIDLAIVGEPTGMRAAIAERGLLVLDGASRGVSGHAARGEGDNAIYKAVKDIETLKRHHFARVSPTMGAVRLAVTQIEAGERHNVVPDLCRFVVDVRPTDVYSNSELLAELQAIVESNLTPRSLTNRSSASPEWLVRLVGEMGIETFVSPTTSDWMRLGDIPAVKMGPGDSSRSHAPGEYILRTELADGTKKFINFLKHLENVDTLE